MGPAGSAGREAGSQVGSASALWFALLLPVLPHLISPLSVHRPQISQTPWGMKPPFSHLQVLPAVPISPSDGLAGAG